MEASARKANVIDALRLWRRMRPIDREEASIVTRWPVLLTLLWGVLFTEVVALYADGELLALYGVRDRGFHLGYHTGLIWMLSTRAVSLHRRAVMVACADYVADCAERFELLTNAVYAKNDKALRFVRRLGFHVCEPAILRGELFHPIVRLSCAA